MTQSRLRGRFARPPGNHQVPERTDLSTASLIARHLFQKGDSRFSALALAGLWLSRGAFREWCRRGLAKPPPDYADGRGERSRWSRRNSRRGSALRRSVGAGASSRRRQGRCCWSDQLGSIRWAHRRKEPGEARWERVNGSYFANVNKCLPARCDRATRSASWGSDGNCWDALPCWQLPQGPFRLPRRGPRGLTTCPCWGMPVG